MLKWKKLLQRKKRFGPVPSGRKPLLIEPMPLNTVSQKTSPSFISRSVVKHCPILIIFSRNIHAYIGLKRQFHFPPHLTCVSTLPEEIQSVNLTKLRLMKDGDVFWDTVWMGVFVIQILNIGIWLLFTAACSAWCRPICDDAVAEAGNICALLDRLGPVTTLNYVAMATASTVYAM